MKCAAIARLGGAWQTARVEISMRPAESFDVPALSRLATDSFVAKFGHLYRPLDLSAFLAEAMSEAAIAAELANPHRLYRLAEIEGRLAGYCKLGLACGFPQHARSAHVLELKQLYTDPEMTGHRIGSALMDWAMAECAARGAEEIQLSVYCDNTGAQRFYKRYGFDKVADVHFWVGAHRDDEFLYSRLL